MTADRPATGPDYETYPGEYADIEGAAQGAAAPPAPLLDDLERLINDEYMTCDHRVLDERHIPVSTIRHFIKVRREALRAAQGAAARPTARPER